MVNGVGILSIAKVLDVIYAVLRFLLGRSAPSSRRCRKPLLVAGAMFALFLGRSHNHLQLFSGLVGFVSGLISTLTYNVIAETIGGMEIEVEEVSWPGSPLSS